MKYILHTFKNVQIYTESRSHSQSHSGKYVPAITHFTQKSTVALHTFPQYIKRRKVCNECVITQKWVELKILQIQKNTKMSAK